LDQDDKDQDTTSSIVTSSAMPVTSSESLLAACQEALAKTVNVSDGAAAAALETSPSKNDEDEAVVNAEKLLFGRSLEKHHVANIELDSDQESTDGEGEANDLICLEEGSRLTPDRLLFRAARVHNLPVMSQALAMGADKDWIQNDDAESTSPLLQSSAVIHQSILSGSVMACEYLLLNGAKINLTDGSGNTALHLAVQQRRTAQVCLLLKHRADHKLRNLEQKTALDIALENCDADTVTLLKIAAFKEEMKESGDDVTGECDETWNEVMADFELLASSQQNRTKTATNNASSSNTSSDQTKK